MPAPATAWSHTQAPAPKPPARPAGAAPARPAPAPAPSADPAVLQAAIDKLGKLDYKTRVEASATLRRAPAAAVVPLLVQAAGRHADGYVRFRALVLLSGFNDPKTKSVFLDALGDENDRLREVAYAYVEDHPDPLLVPRLLQALEREQAEFVRPALIRAIAAHGKDPKVQVVLKREVMRGVDFFRSAVIEALGAHKATYALDEISKIAELEGPLQDDAVRALGQIGDKRGLPTLVAVQRERQPGIAADDRGGHLRPGQQLRRACAFRAGIAGFCRAQPRLPGACALVGHGPGRPVGHRPHRSAACALRAGYAGQRPGACAHCPRDRPGGDAQSGHSCSPSSPTCHGRTPRVLLRDAFDMLEEDYAEERFFATVRRQYWEALPEAPMRAAAQVLITALEF